MSDVVKELLAKIGEAFIKGTGLSITKTYDPITKQYIFSLPDEPRKLILDPDGTINWYNCNGPEA